MKNKKGFTLIELLGVITVLAIVLGIVTIAYKYLNEEIKYSYYKNLEQSIMMASGDYLAYNEDLQPNFSETRIIEVNDLIQNKYISEVKAKDGTNCSNSFVSVSKEENQKLNYTVCFLCSDYISDDEACQNKNKNCAYFYINNASKINEEEESLQLCCEPDESNACQVTIPTITPKENHEVLGWSNESSDDLNPTYQAGQEITLTNNNQGFFAITKSLEQEVEVIQITFKLNGATSFTFNNNNYTKDKTLSTESNLILPTIIRDGWTILGWSEDENATEATYTIGEIVELENETTLYAITKKTITLSYDATGGTTTLEPQTETIYNKDQGAWFTIPAYDKTNMCRLKNPNNAYEGFQYLGLTAVEASNTINYCQGDVVYLQNDTTIYAVWKSLYATGKCQTNTATVINIRECASTSCSKVGEFPDARLCTVMAKSGWYYINYNGKIGWASANYIKITQNAPDNSCTQSYSCSSPGLHITAEPSSIVLNLAKEDMLQKQLNVLSECGEYTFNNYDPNLINVSNDGLVTAIPGSVEENERKSTTIDIVSKGGHCTTTVEVLVKNTLATEPTVTISVSGDSSTCSGSYISGATAVVRCESDLPITSYSAKVGSSTGSITNDEYVITSKISLSSTGNKTINVSCTNDEGTSTASQSVTIKVKSSSSSCSCKTRYSGPTATSCSHCSSWSYKGGGSGSGSTRCSYNGALGRYVKYTYLSTANSNGYTMKYYYCSSYKCKTYNTCCHM